jgi:fumarylacetoacetate (FAA) hydrolase
VKLATRNAGGPDGELMIVSRDLSRAISARDSVPNLQGAMESWTEVLPRLEAAARRLEADGSEAGEAFDLYQCMAALPRAWQWLDGSAFETHGRLMQTAFGLPPIETDKPLMYQGLSDRFIGPFEDVRLPSEDDGIDFEGEFGVIVDAVPMGTTPEQAMAHIRLIVQINDWSLRTIAPIEMKTGFGWVQAKPACSMAAVAITPDELGSSWRDGRVCLPLRIDLNGQSFGRALGTDMAYGFHELVAHAARTRDLVAGTVIGSGTVSSPNYAEVGSSCLSERRAIEKIAYGEMRTPFMSFGDRIRMEARGEAGEPLFGWIDQKVIRA